MPVREMYGLSTKRATEGEKEREEEQSEWREREMLKGIAKT